MSRLNLAHERDSLIRAAAAYGLKPHEVYDMTYRELELYMEGQEDYRFWVREILAWTQANLMNIHIPRGKPRVKIQDLLPRRKKRHEEDIQKIEEQLELEMQPIMGVGTSTKDRMKQVAQRARIKKEAKEAAEFWSSNEGARIKMLLGEEE